jgi:hypothetical protein
MSSKQFWQKHLRPRLSGSLFIFLEGKVTWRPYKNGMGQTYLIYTDVNFFRKTNFHKQPIYVHSLHVLF